MCGWVGSVNLPRKEKKEKNDDDEDSGRGYRSEGGYTSSEYRTWLVFVVVV